MIRCGGLKTLLTVAQVVEVVDLILTGNHMNTWCTFLWLHGLKVCFNVDDLWRQSVGKTIGGTTQPTCQVFIIHQTCITNSSIFLVCL